MTAPSDDPALLPPSRVHLPRLEPAPATIFAFLTARFPHIPPEVWRDRFARGRVRSGDGAPLREEASYRPGVTVLYWREVVSEPEAVEAERIVYRDAAILVADKPHGMPVTPAGDHVERSLLVRLQRRTGVAALAPAHRLDRETAGLVLFCLDPAVRGRYHRLFAEGRIEREYLAVARLDAPPRQTQWRVRTRIAVGDPWHRRRIVEGPVNAVTGIELLETRPGAGLFRIRPHTGKKHQIRVHLASIGFPILGDPLYPEIRERRDGDPPMQLLAARLTFHDPVTGALRSFESGRTLAWA